MIMRSPVLRGEKFLAALTEGLADGCALIETKVEGPVGGGSRARS